MDKLDLQILSKLQSEGFQKSTTLACILGVGERTIRRRMNIMITNKLIKVIAVPDPVLLGYRAWAKIGIKVVPEFLKNVARMLVTHPSIYFVAYALGRFDIMVAVHFDTVEKLTHFVNSELTRVKGILSTETMILSCPRKYYHFSWPAPIFEKSRNTWDPYHNATVGRSHYEADELDRGILYILMENGLTRPTNLKLRLGIGEGTIRKHMKNMLSNEVYKLVVVPNPEVLEYEIWATMGIVINQQSAHNIIDSIIKHPAVYLASVSLGRFNIIIAARFHNIDVLDQFVREQLTPMQGISAVETYLHNKPLKYHNITWRTS